MSLEEQEQEAADDAGAPAPQAPPAPEPPAAPAAPAAIEGGEGAPAAATTAPAHGPRPERGPRRDAGDGEGPRRRHFGRRRVCMFCAEKVKSIDYKDSMRLRRFLSDRARIEPRRKTGTCAKHQRWLAVALKRARHLALLPYTPEHIRVSGVSTGRGR